MANDSCSSVCGLDQETNMAKHRCTGPELLPVPERNTEYTKINGSDSFAKILYPGSKQFNTETLGQVYFVWGKHWKKDDVYIITNGALIYHRENPTLIWCLTMYS